MQIHNVLAIDPGREKCGIAIVHKVNGLEYKTIIETNKLAEVVNSLIQSYNVPTIVMGDGTTSLTAQAALSRLKINGEPISIIKINEYRSTDEARRRYWADNPPKGLWRLIPTTMQTPPVPVDDYVAVILAERYFKAANT